MQICRHFSDGFLNAFFHVKIYQFSLQISLKFVPKVRTDNIAALIQIMACRVVGAKPLSEPMLEFC